MNDHMVEVQRPFFTAVIARYPAGLRMRAHAHDFTGLSVVLAGSVIEDVGAVRVEAQAACSVRKPRATMHANEFGPNGATMLSIMLNPNSDFAPSNSPSMWQWRRTLEAYREALHITAALRAAPSSVPAEASLDDLVVDLLAAIDPPALAPPRRTPQWLDDIKAYLDEGRAESASVVALAHAAGVHPVYLARRFRQAYGCSVARHRRRARVLASISSIASSRRSLSVVAAEHGFADHSHLSREFRKALGVSPSEMRAIVPR